MAAALNWVLKDGLVGRNGIYGVGIVHIANM